MRILIVGGGGFVGGALRVYLAGRGHDVFCADRVQTRPDVLSMDLGDRESIIKVLRQSRPDRIFHLAAQSKIPLSWENPEMTMDVNLTGSVRLFMCAIEVVPQARFIFIGSGSEYGSSIPARGVWSEESTCVPENPYSASKYFAGMTLGMLANKHKSDFVHLRPFNHYGPGQLEGFVIADFCAQIVRAEIGMVTPEIKVGNLIAERDFLYIDDVLSAYCMIAEKPKLPNNLYNICSEKRYAIGTILDILLAQAKVKISVVSDLARVRGVEKIIPVASSNAMFCDFGWESNTSLRDGLRLTLDYWRMLILEMVK